MLKYQIYEHKTFKVIFDIEEYLKRRFKNNTKCYVKKFSIDTSDGEINEYILEKLGGNPEFDVLRC